MIGVRINACGTNVFHTCLKDLLVGRWKGKRVPLFCSRVTKNMMTISDCLGDRDKS